MSIGTVKETFGCIREREREEREREKERECNV